MIAKEFWRQEGIKERLAMISEERSEMRAVYSSETGIKQLVKIIKSGHVFDTMTEDSGENFERNFVINMMEELGFLDEGNIEKICRFMLSLPVLPDAEV